MRYNELKGLESNNKQTLSSMFNGLLSNIKNISFKKTTSIIKDIPSICEMSFKSSENTEFKRKSYDHFHPIIPKRGEIYNAFITEGVGKELAGNHLVIVIQDVNSNLYSDKVTVIPIEGNGKVIKKSYQLRLTNEDLSSGHIDKDPSRIIFSDIMTLDKARLVRKIGCLTNEKMLKINTLLKKHLSL